MRILVFSDIHANLTALETVFANVGEVDAAWCLGDLVGYGPDPNECIERIQELPNLVCILGNHDAATLKQIDSATFNPEARNAIHWTQNTLKDANFKFLSQLPQRVNNQNITLVHGSPRQPIWEYLLDAYNATQSFKYFDTPYCFVGHTHIPILYYLAENRSSAKLYVPKPDTNLSLQPRMILNPGSVGQPRDRDPRAAYAIFNDQERTWELHRVEYDIESVQSRMWAAKLSQRHIQRLSAGW